MSTLRSNVIRARDLKNEVGLCRSSVYRLMARGEFPNHVKLGPNSVGWLRADIDAWLEQGKRAAWLEAIGEAPLDEKTAAVMERRDRAFAKSQQKYRATKARAEKASAPAQRDFLK